MKEIDWSKAPEGATHARKHNSGVDWYKRENGSWLYYSPRGIWERAYCTSEADCVQRPAWNGTGLPPVGAACELQQEVKRLFSYDPESGVLRWKENQQKRFIGREAGSINHHGYRRVNLGKTKLHAHQIIWLMNYGELPNCEIDHVNGIRDDNRLENLRLATQQQNQQNSGVRIDNALGVKGVRLRPSGNYQARVKLSDGSRAVKTFRTVIEAVSWLALQREMSHGEYANTPEQIAAEERGKAIVEMAFDMQPASGDASQIIAERLYDAGYRKTEAKQ